jgi:co-chaperonin GroES (HSP10)
MMRPIGPRVLVRPVPPPADPDPLLVQLEEPPITQGDVIAVGQCRCPECGEPQTLDDLLPGARVLLRPTAIVQEITMDGETVWMVPLADVVAEVLIDG